MTSMTTTGPMARRRKVFGGSGENLGAGGQVDKQEVDVCPTRVVKVDGQGDQPRTLE